MELDQQLKLLIEEAANYGVPTRVMKEAIAPVLKSLATQLQHEEYYILQNLESDWVLTTITNPQSKQEKKVIYAFTTVEHAAVMGKADRDLIAAPISAIQLLFRLFSLQQVNSIIFMLDSSNPNKGVEIRRDRFLESIQQQIGQIDRTPPDIA
jgi:hypothetical protein